MTYTSEQNEDTTNKQKREVTQDGELNLKSKREDARKGNYNRVAHKESPPPDDLNVESKTEEKTSKMERRLSNVREFTRSLPKHLTKHLVLWAKRLISNVMTHSHYEKRRTFILNNPLFTPKSIRLKYEHQTKIKLKGNREFEELRDAARAVISEAKQKLRLIIRSTQDLEEQEAKNDIKKYFYRRTDRSFHLLHKLPKD